MSSRLVTSCQICGGKSLDRVIFLGYLPPVNHMRPIGSAPQEEASYPAQLLRCPNCTLMQLGLIVDPEILFPPEYPYTSGTTKVLRENFAELAREIHSLFTLAPGGTVIDVGSNDGTLLSNFQGTQRVLGIEPTDTGKLAVARGIETISAYFTADSARLAVERAGPAALVTATNVFAHIQDVDSVTEAIVSMLGDNGVFVSESHYLLGLMETVQYDTIYHEHLRYYSLESLRFLLEKHGLEIFFAKRIPTHGGSIRVYAAPRGRRTPRPEVARLLGEEKRVLTPEGLETFKRRVLSSKLGLYGQLLDIKRRGGRIFGISAPSRASTLIHYVGLDDALLDCVVEVKGSHKIGKYMPGTLIEVHEESRLFKEQPEYALLLSWHIADELIPKLWEKGFKGSFIVPLPEPRIVSR